MHTVFQFLGPFLKLISREKLHQVARMKEQPNDGIVDALQKMRDDLDRIVDEACRQGKEAGEEAVEGAEERS